ncbi:MAG: nuclear transport factor 2 family protein [Flavitalea sp.]
MVNPFMRTQKIWFCLIAVLTFSFSQTRAQDAQDEAIKKVISEETNSYFKKDSTGWASTWLMDAKTTRTFAGNGGYFTEAGWDKIGPEAMANFKNNPKPDTVDVVADSFIIRTEGKIAVVDYQQTINYKTNPAPFNKAISREHRVLIKKDGKWKIACQITNDITLNGVAGSELAMNNLEYTCLKTGKMIWPSRCLN